METRLLTANRSDPYADFALEEAIFRGLKGVTVRVWRNSLSVVIGRAQLAKLETNLAYCAKSGIPVVRRFTAGGTVYNGPGNVNWSFFIPAWFEGEGLAFVRSPSEVFRMASSVVITALRNCGVRAWLESPNRIVNGEGKVGGMAAYISNRGLLCHGTLLAGADLGELKRLTTPVRRKADRRYVRSNSMRVANTGISYERFVREMRIILEESEGSELKIRSQPTSEELHLAEILYEERYGRDEWNLGDPFCMGGGLLS